jgi:hypothetical protein
MFEFPQTDTLSTPLKQTEPTPVMDGADPLQAAKREFDATFSAWCAACSIAWAED